MTRRRETRIKYAIYGLGGLVLVLIGLAVACQNLPAKRALIETAGGICVVLLLFAIALGGAQLDAARREAADAHAEAVLSQGEAEAVGRRLNAFMAVYQEDRRVDAELQDWLERSARSAS